MTAMADAGTTRGTRDAGPSPADEDIQALKCALQNQRRQTTLLNADLQRQIEAREAVQAQLLEALAELTASRDRRKEMARVISDRDAKVAALYEDLAALERHILRSTLSGKARELFRRTKRLMRRAFRQKARS